MEKEVRALARIKDEQEQAFFQKRAQVEQLAENLVEGKRYAERDFRDMQQTTSYYLKAYGVDEAEVHQAMRIIEGNYEEVATQFDQFEKQVEVEWEEEVYHYRKTLVNLDQQLEEARRGEK